MGTIIRRMGLVAVALAAGCCFVELGGMGCSYRARAERKVELHEGAGPGSQVEVHTGSGSIRIQGAEVNECTVTATIVAQAETEDKATRLADQVAVAFHRDGSRLILQATQPPGIRNQASISYDVKVPVRTDVDCRSGFGKVVVRGVEGSVKAGSDSGAVEVDGIGGTVDLSSGFGAITCRSVRNGDIRLATSSGAIHITDANAPTCRATTSFGQITCDRVRVQGLELRSNSGAIRVADVSADALDLHSDFGAIHGRQVTCTDLKAHTNSGQIQVDFSADAPAEVVADVSTSFGAIAVTAPSRFSGQVELSTDFGTVETAMPLLVSGRIDKAHLRGAVGEGKGRLVLKTSSGAIHLR
jgi:hypothetical protein